MKIALDTQVLFWYFFGKTKYVFEKINVLLETNEVYIFDNILQEFCDLIFRSGLREKGKGVWEENVEIVKQLMFSQLLFKIKINPLPIDNQIKTRDHKDDRLLNSSIVNGIGLIISNDKDLLSLKNSPIRIKSINEI